MTDGEIRGAARVLCVFARRRRRLLTKSKKTRKRNHSSVFTLNRTFRIFFLASCRTKRKNRRLSALSAYYRRYTVLANRNLTPSPESEPFAAKAEAPTVSRVRRDIFSSVWQQSSCAYTIRARLCMRVWAVCGVVRRFRPELLLLHSSINRGRIGSDRIPLSLFDARGSLPKKQCQNQKCIRSHTVTTSTTPRIPLHVYVCVSAASREETDDRNHDQVQPKSEN